MIVRFFIIMQRGWTYEIEYRLEIARMVFIHVVFLGGAVLISRVVDKPSWIRLLALPLIVFWWCYSGQSLGRMLQIKNNRRFAVKIDRRAVKPLLKAYPKNCLWCKVNGKYKKILSPDDVSEGDDILLITIGKKRLDGLRKYKKVLQSLKEGEQETFEDMEAPQ